MRNIFIFLIFEEDLEAELYIFPSSTNAQLFFSPKPGTRSIDLSDRLLPQEMASSLVPEGVLLSVGDFAFINQLMKLDGVIDEAIELLKAGNYSNYREVCTTVHSRISALEKDQEAEAEAGAKAAAAPGDERPAGGDEVPSLPLPQNRLYYVFTEIYREGVAKAPVDVVPAQNRSDIGKYVLGEATASIRAWIIGHAQESFLSVKENR